MTTDSYPLRISAIINFSYPFQTDYLTSAKMDIATNSKIPYTGHQKLGQNPKIRFL